MAFNHPHLVPPNTMVKARNGHVSEEEEVEEVSENEVDGSEEEYEIETILDAKQGAFEGVGRDVHSYF